MEVRTVIFFACMLVMAAGCGDPQLNESRREFYLVTLSEWHTRYTPGITAVVAFPELSEVSAPRFTSSDPSVARVSVFNQSVDQPRFRALEITTGSNGDTDISLFDGDRLIRTETVEVYEPAGFSFDFTIQNEVAPPEAALRADERVAVVELAPAPAVLRFYRDGLDREVVAAGRPSVSYVSDHVVLERRITPVTLPISTGDGEYRLQGQLSSGDIWIITALDYFDLRIDLPTRESIRDDPEIGFERRGAIRDLEIIASPRRVGNRASIAVFGKDGNNTRVVGLDPVVTLDGEPLQHCRFDSECSGEIPLNAEWRWLFPLPDGVESGAIEAKWQGLTASVDLGATE